uniref:Dynein light chain roadblock-type 1 n=1 Tax=Caenorhabditis tropicalis TaxID=1561998 RepID=A0A1I7TA25_9PELO
MSKSGKKSKPKYTLENIQQIPNLVAFMVCKGNSIVHNTFPETENVRQIAYNAMRMATRTQGTEMRDLKIHTIQVQYDDFQVEMFQVGSHFCIVKKRAVETE